MDTTKQTTLEQQLENGVRNTISIVEQSILLFIRLILFVLRLPRQVLPAVLHVAAFTAVLPVLVGIAVGAGITVVNLIPSGWNNELWMQYGEQATPFARTSLPALVPGQPYEISLTLEIPLSSDNMALGNFMAKLLIIDPKNTTAVSVSRPALVLGKKPSGWVPFMGHTTLIDKMDIPLLDDWTPTLPQGILTSHGAAIARGTTQKDFQAVVSVGRSDAWRNLGSGEGRELSIIRAVLHGRVKLFGIRGYFARHTFQLFALVTTAFFVTSTGMALLLYFLFAPTLSNSRDSGDDTTVKTLRSEQDVTPRPRIKPEETEPFSASETETSWTSGGLETLIKQESEEEYSSESI